MTHRAARISTRTGVLAALVVVVAMLAPAAATAKAPPGFFGVVAQGVYGEHGYELMEDAGVGNTRVQFSWALVQPEAGRCQSAAQVGVCDWRVYDYFAGLAAAHGMAMFPYAVNVPGFVAKDPETPPIRSKRAKSAWTDFLEAAAKRYGPGGSYWKTQYPIDHPGASPVPVEDWQIWNEPSSEPFWNPKPKPREYAKLVKISSQAITGVDRSAHIVLAGLFGTPTIGIDQPKFIRGVYNTPGIERYFDAVAIHPYGPDIARVKFQVDWALDEIRRAGDRNVGLWISEIGWASDHVHNQLGVGKKGQAKLLTKAFKLFEKKRRSWNIEGVDWYAWQDSDLEGLCDFCRRSGLVDLEGDPKLSYDAFRSQARG